MTFEELSELWSKDCHIDPTDLGGQALAIPKVHQKYYRFYLKERAKLTNLKFQVQELEGILWKLYSKSMTKAELAEYDLEMPDKHILKPDIPKYIESHPDMIELKKRVAMQSEKVDYLKEILKQINNRGFQIRDAIEWLKFTQGQTA